MIPLTSSVGLRAMWGSRIVTCKHKKSQYKDQPNALKPSSLECTPCPHHGQIPTSDFCPYHGQISTSYFCPYYLLSYMQTTQVNTKTHPMLSTPVHWSVHGLYIMDKFKFQIFSPTLSCYITYYVCTTIKMQPIFMLHEIRSWCHNWSS